MAFANAYYDEQQNQNIAPTLSQLQGNFSEPLNAGVAATGTGDADTYWNQGWNMGFNNPSTGYSGSDVNEQAGYIQGQKDYWLRNPQTTTSPTTNNNPQPTTPQPTNNTSGELSFDDIYNQVYPGWGRQEAYNDWVAKGKPQPTIGTGANGQLSEEQLAQQLTNDLNSAYQPAMDVLGQQEQYLRDAQPASEKAIQDQFSLRRGEQEGDWKSAQEQSELTQRKLWDEKENVLDQSRRLYDELRRGARQRFGGSSSAGEAVNTLLGLEQQRQMGDTKRTYMNNIAEWERSKADTERAYKQNVAQLNLAKDEAIRKSQDAFNAGMLQIAQSKAGLMTEKGLRRLDLLTNLRDSIMKAQATAQEWQDKLSYQRELAEMNFAYRLQEIQAMAKYKTYAPTKSSYSTVDVDGTTKVFDKTTGQVSDIGSAQGQIGLPSTYKQYYGLDEEV